MRKYLTSLINKNKFIESIAKNIYYSIQNFFQAFVQGMQVFFARKTNLIRRQDFPSFYLGRGIFTNRYLGERTMTSLTVLAINQTFPFLNDLVESVSDKNKDYSVDEFASLFNEIDVKVVDELKGKFNEYGSDKAGIHNYYLIYSCILHDPNSISSLMEIGLGTNNTDIPSNMGAHGKPGASLRAFRDFLPNANIYGADIDKRILFTEDRITTFFVDQTRPETFEQLNNHIPIDFDVIIDDGLHSPNANIATLTFALSKLKDGGWCIIEDILEDAIEIWHVIASIMPKDTYKCYIVKSKTAHLFLCQKSFNEALLDKK